MAAPATSQPKGKYRRELKDLDGLPRSAMLSSFRSAFERTGHDVAAHWPSLALFSFPALWQWIREYTRHVSEGRYPLPSYKVNPTKCSYPLRDANDAPNVRIGLAGDWGTGTQEAHDVAEGMVESDPHFTIHLGDVYYIGDQASIEENCLGIRNPANGYTPVKWPWGSLGSFAMLGNHEMYATGKAYVLRFLPTLGLRKAGVPTGQTTSYFCLENEHWKVIALDTGYNSRGLPFLNFLPSVPFIGKVFSFLKPSCKLTDDQLEWLQNVVKPSEADGRGIILLSHHQYFTVFTDDEDFTKPAEQLRSLIDRPALWFWGHEHRMAGYEYSGPKDLQVHGRCIGHGGMPVSRRDPPPNKGNGKLLFYDNRLYKDGFGMNGYATFAFNGRHLTVEYFDVHCQKLLSEEWDLDSSGGLVRRAVNQICFEKDFYGPTKWG